MLRSRHLMFSALLGASLVASAACGDSDTKSKDTATATDTVQPDTAPPADTEVPDTAPPADTVVPDTTQPVDTTTPAEVEVANECPPETAGKGFVGSPCTKDCECQTVHGKPLFCYNGFYMHGFSVCTDYADNRSPANDIQEDELVDTLQFSGDCFPDLPNASDRRPLYAHLCNTVDDCLAISAAYTDCGTGGGDFSDWAPDGRGTYCPTASGSNRTISLNSTCLIATTPPFDGSYVNQ